MAAEIAAAAHGSDPDSPCWDDETDVVVLGSGAAGLTAALTAVTLGAEVELFEKASTVGGTSAVSGGMVWVPAHERAPEIRLPVEDALRYLEAQAFGPMDTELVEAFVRTAPTMIDFVEANSPLRFETTDFPDYKPELPGGKPGGGRSLSPVPFDLGLLGEWSERITTFPQDWSNVGFDAETRARLNAGAEEAGDLCVAGTALVAGLLRGLLDHGVVPRTRSRAIGLHAGPDRIDGVTIAGPDGNRRVRARRGVVLAAGGFEWDRELVDTFLRGPMHGSASPPLNTGDALRMAMAHGAALGSMGEAWWVPIVQIPGDTFGDRPRSRSVRLERTRPRSIIVNRAGERFVNEACDYNSMAGAFHYLHPRDGYVNDRAWIVFDSLHLKRYGFLGIAPGEPAPDWFHGSPDLDALAEAIGVDAVGLNRTVEEWNLDVVRGADGRFGRGASAYDSWWGDERAATAAGRTLGPIDTGPFYAVPLTVGSMGTKGGPRTDREGRVLHVSGGHLTGLLAAGNAMAGVTGRAYGGAGGTLGPAMTWGYRAAHFAATGVPAA